MPWSGYDSNGFAIVATALNYRRQDCSAGPPKFQHLNFCSTKPLISFADLKCVWSFFLIKLLEIMRKGQVQIEQHLEFSPAFFVGSVLLHVLSRFSRVLLHGLQPARLLCPWDSPGKNTGAGGHFPLQGSSWPRGLLHLSALAGGFFTTSATWVCQNVYLGFSVTSYATLWPTHYLWVKKTSFDSQVLPCWLIRETNFSCGVWWWS